VRSLGVGILGEGAVITALSVGEGRNGAASGAGARGDSRRRDVRSRASIGSGQAVGCAAGRALVVVSALRLCLGLTDFAFLDAQVTLLTTTGCGHTEAQGSSS